MVAVVKPIGTNFQAADKQARCKLGGLVRDWLTINEEHHAVSFQQISGGKTGLSVWCKAAADSSMRLHLLSVSSQPWPR